MSKEQSGSSCPIPRVLLWVSNAVPGAVSAAVEGCSEQEQHSRATGKARALFHRVGAQTSAKTLTAAGARVTVTHRVTAGPVVSHGTPGRAPSHPRPAGTGPAGLLPPALRPDGTRPRSP